MSELRMENRRHASASKALKAPWRPVHYTLKSDACDPPLAENSRKGLEVGVDSERVVLVFPMEMRR